MKAVTQAMKQPLSGPCDGDGDGDGEYNDGLKPAYNKSGSLMTAKSPIVTSCYCIAEYWIKRRAIDSAIEAIYAANITQLHTSLSLIALTKT